MPVRLVSWVLVLLAGGAALSGQAQTPPVRIETQLSQTAVWRGDEFEYVVALRHRPGVEIVQENLRAESLNVEPFVLRSVVTERRPAAGDEGVLEVRLRLVLLESAGTEAVIPPLTIYYATRKPGPLGKGTDVETHSVVVPQKVVGVATTLTRDSKDIRDGAMTFAVDSAGRAIWLFGWTLLGAVVLQSLYWGYTEYRRRAGTQRKRNRRTIERHAMDRLDALEAETRTEAGSTRASLEQYGELATTVSAAVGELTGIPAQSLTPSEVEDELLRMNAPAALAQSVRHLLNECEHVRYRRANAEEKRADFASLVESSRMAVTEVARL